MSFNHIINTIFDRLSIKLRWTDYDRLTTSPAISKRSHEQNWLEQETSYVVARFTDKEILQTPHFLGLSQFMTDDERTEFLSLLWPDEHYEFSKISEQFFNGVMTHFRRNASTLPRFETFLQHWLVNLFIRKQFDLEVLGQLRITNPDRHWEHHALLMEAIKSGRAPDRNMAVKYRLTTPTASGIYEVMISTAPLCASSGGETGIAFHFNEPHLPLDAKLLALSAPHIEWLRLPVTGEAYRAMIWEFKTLSKYTPRLELPLAHFSSHTSLVSPESVGASDDSRFTVVVTDTADKLSATHSVRDIKNRSKSLTHTDSPELSVPFFLE